MTTSGNGNERAAGNQPPFDFDVCVVSGAGIDTNVYLPGADIDFSVEANFTTNLDTIGQAGGYSARGFARLGKRTALIDSVGDDPSGHWIRHTLAEDGINMDGVCADPAGTRRSVNIMYRDGRRKNFYDARGAMTFRPDLTRCRAVLERARLVHFNIIDWARFLLPFASRPGVTVSCDLQDVVDPRDPYRADFVAHADILFFSAANQEDSGQLARFYAQERRGRIVVCGMGARGCAVAWNGSYRQYPAVSLPDPVTDTNGAGDSLAVAFLSSFVLDGYALEDSILRGQIAARHACSLRGSSDFLITREQLDAIHAGIRPASVQGP